MSHAVCGLRLTRVREDQQRQHRVPPHPLADRRMSSFKLLGSYERKKDPKNRLTAAMFADVVKVVQLFHVAVSGGRRGSRGARSRCSAAALDPSCVCLIVMAFQGADSFNTDAATGNVYRDTATSFDGLWSAGTAPAGCIRPRCRK